MKILDKFSNIPFLILFLVYFLGFRQELSTGIRLTVDILIALAIVLKLGAWLIEKGKQKDK